MKITKDDNLTIEKATTSYDEIINELETAVANLNTSVKTRCDDLEKDFDDFSDDLKKSNMHFIKINWIAFSLVIACITTIAIGAIHDYHKKYIDLVNRYNYISNQYDALYNKCDYLYDEVNSFYDELSLYNIELEKPINTEVISEKSNLTTAQINRIISEYLNDNSIEDSALFNLGESIHNMEERYNVNALFCLAVAINESASGTATNAINNNNIFGLVRDKRLIEFSSIDECIQYWGNLIRYKYIDTGLISLYAIQNKYAPEYTEWTDDIKLINEVLAKYV